MGTAFKDFAWVENFLKKLFPNLKYRLYVAANLHTQLICHIKDVRNFI